MKKVKRNFTKVEYQKLRKLIELLQVADPNKQKAIRAKLRKAGLY